MEVYKLSRRLYGLDFIKTLGIFLVIMVHGLGAAELLTLPLNSYTALGALLLRIFSMTSIPLFLISMGFLNHKYQFNSTYLARIKPILFSYFLAVTLSLLSDFFILNKQLTLGSIVGEYLDLNVSNYAWYARMYVMLFLLIPFLNNWFTSFSSKKEEKLFIIILCLVSSVPATFNSLFAELKLPLSAPAYFVQLYPILYYFIGVYIAKNKVTLKKIKVIVCISLLVVFQVLLFILRFKGNIPNLNMFGSYGSLVNVLLASGIFIVFIDMDFKGSIKKGIVYISSHTFDIYLISHVFDRIMYPIYNLRIPKMSSRLFLLIIPILITLISSIIYVELKGLFKKKINNSY